MENKVFYFLSQKDDDIKVLYFLPLKKGSENKKSFIFPFTLCPSYRIGSHCSALLIESSQQLGRSADKWSGM